MRLSVILVTQFQTMTLNWPGLNIYDFILDCDMNTDSSDTDSDQNVKFFSLLWHKFL